MAALLVGLGVMAVLMSVALPVWRNAARREKEAELVFRGEQYARAVALFQRKFAGAYPPTIDLLVEQRFLRRKYKDPITNDDFQPLMQTSQLPGGGAPGAPPGAAPSGVRPGSGAGSMPAPSQRAGAQRSGSTVTGARSSFGPQGGIIGVTSKSTEKSIKLYRGRGRYNEWVFVYTPTAMQPGAPGTTRPGQVPGRPGTPGSARPGMPTGPGTGPRGFNPPGPPPMRPPGSPPF